MSGYRAKVIGSGVIGLSTAIVLRDLGLSVSMVSNPKANLHRSSDVAAAFWYPFHAGRYSPAWALTTYHYFRSLLTDSRAGICETDSREYYRSIDAFEQWKANTWWKAIPSIRFTELSSADIPSGFKRGAQFTIPVVHMSQYMPFLRNIVLGDITEEFRRVDRIADELHDCDVLIDCAGLGAEHLANDRDVVPGRGQVVIIEPIPVRWLTFLTEEPEYERKPIYIVPRCGIDVLLGGTYDPGDYSLEPREAVTQEIIERCAEFEPAVRNARVIDKGVVGLRPCHEIGVQLREDDSYPGHLVIHNYGHGGSGVTLSWGCALEVGNILSSTLLSK